MSSDEAGDDAPRGRGRPPVDPLAFGVPTPLRALTRRLWSDLKLLGYHPEYYRVLTKAGRRPGSGIIVFTAMGYMVYVNVRSNIGKRRDEPVAAYRKLPNGVVTSVVVAERNSLWHMQFRMSDGFVAASAASLVSELVRRVQAGVPDLKPKTSKKYQKSGFVGRPRKTPMLKNGQILFGWD